MKSDFWDYRFSDIFAVYLDWQDVVIFVVYFLFIMCLAMHVGFAVAR